MERSPAESATAKDRHAEIQQILAVLHKWGIHTLGQLAALDKEELAARLGPESVRLWERANGQSDRLLKFVQPPESFDESFEFEHEIETAEPLLFMLRRFLEQLALRLSTIYLVAKASAFSKFRSRPTMLIFSFGCSTRIWRILNRNIRSSPFRWMRNRSNPPRSNLDYLKQHCAIQINYPKRSRA